MGIEWDERGVHVVNMSRPAPPQPMRRATPEFRVGPLAVTGSAYLGTLMHTIEILAVNVDQDAAEARLDDMHAWAAEMVQGPYGRDWGTIAATPARNPAGTHVWANPPRIWFARREDAFAFLMRWRGVPL